MVLKRIKWSMYKALIHFLWLFPIKKNKIVFMSNLGKQCACNPYYIAKQLENVNGLDIVWLYDKGNAFTANCRTVRAETLRALYELATARVWVDNCRKPIWMRKRKGQFYIQTWHGGIALKKIEKDALDALPSWYEEQAVNDSKMADLFIASSKWNVENYRDAFWYEGEILESGLPRSDVFFEKPEKYSEKVRSFYNCRENIHFALYAPTFRVDHATACYNLDYSKLKDALKKKWGGEWKIIVRLHPNVQQKQGFLSYNDFILNGSSYSEMNELIIASDILITDYSSCMFDAMLAKKKVILFASDYEEYQKDRGGYFKLEELPFAFSDSSEKCIAAVESFDESKYCAKVDCFVNIVGFFEKGTASVQVAERILKEIG